VAASGAKSASADVCCPWCDGTGKGDEGPVVVITDIDGLILEDEREEGAPTG
jgi:hypothetical protein